MAENKFQKIITRIILGVMILFALSVLGVFIAIKCGAEDLWKMDHDIQTVAQEPAADDTLADKVSKNYINGIYGFKNYMNAYTNELLLGRTTLAEAGAGYKKVIGFKVYAPGEYDSILYLDNGYLASANGSENPEDIGAIATKIKKLKETSEAAGAQFVYFQTPGNIDKFGDKDINNKLDFANANADLLIADLKSYGIDVLDYRDVIRERELASSQMITAEEKYENYHSIFYKTDHHWRIESALEATRWLEGQLTDRYNIALNKEILSEENFTSEEYPAQYLGSLGKKATLATCDPDNFVILRPAFTTDITFSVYTGEIKGAAAENSSENTAVGENSAANSALTAGSAASAPEKDYTKKIEKSGTFDQTWNMDMVLDEDIYTRQCYLASAHFVANGLTRVENHLADNDTYVLFVADSMTIPMTTFTGLTCKKAELIDPRYFKSGITDYIKEHKPDIVINSYSTTAVQDFYPLFDFE